MFEKCVREYKHQTYLAVNDLKLVLVKIHNFVDANVKQMTLFFTQYFTFTLRSAIIFFLVNPCSIVELQFI